MNNETVGISAEVAIAESFKVEVSNEYKDRSDEAIVSLLKKDIIKIFKKNTYLTLYNTLQKNKIQLTLF